MIPDIPPARLGETTGGADLHLRYEDVTQDGRLQLTSMAQGLGRAVWQPMMSTLELLEPFKNQGILPILRRMVVVGEGSPVSVHVPVTYEGTWRFAREKDGERLFINMWMDVKTRLGHTFGPPPEASEPLIVIGRVFAEHVITKPFAPPAERKVTRLAIKGLPEIPEGEHVYESGEALVGETPLVDIDDITFGMMHTDSNQHVNSLVYPRLFEEALVRHLAAQTPPDEKLASRLSRSVEVRWRKPFFAGGHARVAARVDGTSTVGTFRDPKKDGPAHCALKMTL